jgi:hypothetical protein
LCTTAPLRELPAARLVQIVCAAPQEVAIARYASRERHPHHLDAAIVNRPDELAARIIAL